MRTSISTDAGTPPVLSDYAHLIAIYLVWGASYLATKITLSGPEAVTAIQLQSSRMWCASLLLGVVAFVRRGRPRSLSRSDLGLCAASGLLMWVLGNGLATLASHYAASSFIVMALGAIPLWICLLDLLIDRKLPSLHVALGLVLGLCGLFLVVLPTLIESRQAVIAPGYAELTVGILIAAGISWSLGTIVQRPLMRRLAPEWAGALQMQCAALVLTGLSVQEGAPLPGVPALQQWLGFGFLVVFASVIGLTSYIRVIGSFSPVIASTFAYVNPIVGVLLGWLILSEEIAPLSMLGLLLVLISIAVILRRRG